MIKLENVDICGWEAAIRGMRNPMNSWAKSDSDYRRVLGQMCEECGKYSLPDEHSCDGCAIEEMTLDLNSFAVGPNDEDLMLRLAKAGSVEGKFRRMIVVYVDITAPLYWWKEFDTYKVGTVANSCSTMHKIHSKEFTLEDFSHEHLGIKTLGMNAFGEEEPIFQNLWIDSLKRTIYDLNIARNFYNYEQDPELKKSYWWQMIQLLPSSYNQKRTVMMNYEVLANIYRNRRNHKLDEWRELCRWIEGLPYSNIITCSCDTEK